MTTVLVRHSVRSYEDWKPVFDGHEEVRRLHGATGHRILRDGEDITILTDFPDRSGAEAFATDPNLAEVMDKAGVISKPEVSFLDDVERTTY